MIFLSELMNMAIVKMLIILISGIADVISFSVYSFPWRYMR